MASTLVALQTVTVGAGGAASVTFSSIPQTYTDLVVKICARSAKSSADDGSLFGINGNTWTYKATGILLRGNGTTTVSASAPYLFAGYMPAATATANTFSNTEIYFTNYSSDSNKSISIDTVQENNTTAAVQQMNAMLWSDPAAITSIVLTTDSTSNFVQYSTFTLYGVYKSPLETTPEAPTIGTATAASTGANVAFTPSGSGAPASTYIATSSPGGITATGASSPILVTGLTSGTAYTFTVAGQNPGGTGAASAASNSVTPYDGYESIATLYPTGTTATFSSIPSGFTHLQIRAIARDTSTGSPNIAMIFNGDGGSNYTYYHQLVGDGASASAGAAVTAANTIPWYINNANSLANVFTACITDILDYTNTNKLKVHRSISSFDVNGSGGFVTYRSGTWRSTSAITSITLTALSAFASGTVIELYGIR